MWCHMNLHVAKENCGKWIIGMGLCNPIERNNTLIIGCERIVGWIVSPKKICLRPSPPVPVNVTLFENRIFVDVMQLRWGRTELGWALNSVTGVPLRRACGDTATQRLMGWMPCDDRSSDWSDAATSQGMARMAGSQQKLGERPGTDSPSEPPEGTNPVDTLILGF